MADGAGVLRSADSLRRSARTLTALGMPRAGGNTVTAGPDAWETTNLRTVATVLVAAAAMRHETRGSHWREDFPDTDDVAWRGHILTRLDAEGELSVTYEALDISDMSNAAGGPRVLDASAATGRASDAA